MSIPILDALKRHKASNQVSFHMPGHKSGTGASPELVDVMGPDVFSLDLTEIPGLDDLSNPTGAIYEAQKLAARTFGAEHSWLCIGGATAGVIASILAVCRPGEQIIIPRDAHRSVVAGLVLSGAQPVFVYPEWREDLEIVCGITEESLKVVMEENPSASAVLLVNPNYHGICGDIASLIDLVHHNDKVCIVDEAHGSHFRFLPSGPKTALEAGADLVIHGCHKTLGSLTQSGMLHLQGKRVNSQRISRFLNLIQSTSPSYLLMASLDASRDFMNSEGKARFSVLLAQIEEERERLCRETEEGICLGKELAVTPGFYDIDPLHLTIFVKSLNLNGFEVETCLREYYGIQVEMASISNILALITLGDDKTTLAGLVDGFVDLYNKHYSPRNTVCDQTGTPWVSAQPSVAMNPRDAIMRDSKTISLRDSVGKVSSGTVCAYPPGIPVLYPGEKIEPEIASHLTFLKRAGAKFHGLTPDLAIDVID